MTPRIFWIGDSTVQFNNISTWPQCGMGQVLDLYVRPGIAVYAMVAAPRVFTTRACGLRWRRLCARAICC